MRTAGSTLGKSSSPTLEVPHESSNQMSRLREIDRDTICPRRTLLVPCPVPRARPICPEDSAMTEMTDLIARLSLHQRVVRAHVFDCVGGSVHFEFSSDLRIVGIQCGIGTVPDSQFWMVRRERPSSTPNWDCVSPRDSLQVRSSCLVIVTNPCDSGRPSVEGFD